MQEILQDCFVRGQEMSVTEKNVKTNLKVQCNANAKTAILYQNYKIDISKVIDNYNWLIMLKKYYQ